MRQVIAAVCAALFVASCTSPLAQLNPPSLVEDDQSLMAIEEFLYATEALAAASSFGVVHFQRDTSSRMRRLAQASIPLLPPDREKIPYSRMSATGTDNPADIVAPSPIAGAPPVVPTYGDLVRFYIETGSTVAQMVCTQFMTDLYDRDQYFEYIRSQLNTGYTLTNAIFQLAKANGTLKDTVSNVFPIINTGLDNYQKFKYIAVSDATLRGLVLQAMQAKTGYYLLPSAGTPPIQFPNLPFTFSGAVNAVNEIEYLCTRQGIAYLLNHGVAQTHVSTDPNGAIVFNQIPASTGPDKNNPPGNGQGNPPGSGQDNLPGLAAPTNH